MKPNKQKKGLRKKFHWNKEGFCSVCDFYVEQSDESHYCEVYNNALDDIFLEASKMLINGDPHGNNAIQDILNLIK